MSQINVDKHSMGRTALTAYTAYELILPGALERGGSRSAVGVATTSDVEQKVVDWKIEREEISKESSEEGNAKKVGSLLRLITINNWVSNENGVRYDIDKQKRLLIVYEVDIFEFDI